MSTEEKIERAREIFGEIDALNGELAELFGGAMIEEVAKKPKKREAVEVAGTDAPYGFKKNGAPRKWPAKSDDEAAPVVHECCGSKGHRHLSSCKNKGLVPDVANSNPYKFTHKRGRPPTPKDEPEPEAEDLRCGNCEEHFTAVYLDATCPGCGSTNVYKLPA